MSNETFLVLCMKKTILGCKNTPENRALIFAVLFAVSSWHFDEIFYLLAPEEKFFKPIPNDYEINSNFSSKTNCRDTNMNGYKKMSGFILSSEIPVLFFFNFPAGPTISVPLVILSFGR